MMDISEDGASINRVSGQCKMTSDDSQDFHECNSDIENYDQTELKNTSEEDIFMGLTPKRWAVLFLFSMISMANAALWITIPSISNISMAYYDISAISVDWFSMLFLLGYAIFAMPASAFMERFGVKACLLTAASLNGVAGSLRFAGVERSRFIFVFTGQVFAAIGSAFVLQVPPKLAAVWFGEHERATATSIGVLMNLVGVAVGFIQPTSVVDDSKDMNIVHDGMFSLLLSQALFCIATLVCTYIIVDEKPQLPPSRSEALRDMISGEFHVHSFGEAMKTLFKSRDFILTAQAYGLMFGLLTCVTTLLNQVTKSQYALVSDFKIGMMGFVGTIFGAVSTLCVGILIDRFPRYKEVAIVISVSSVLSLAGFSVLLLYFQNFVALFFFFCLFNVALIPFLGSGLTQLAEITYPVSEELSSTIALVLGNFYGFVSTYFFGWLLDRNLPQLTFALLTGLFGLAMIFIFLAKVPRNKTMAEHS